MTCRTLLGACLLALVFAIPAVAQVQLDGLHMNAGGTVELGYSGDVSNQGDSDHGMSVGGAGSIGGYYYHPNFASFSVSPYFNRSQTNSTSSSIEDSSGYSANLNLFGGSRFPATVSFGQYWDSTGNFGIPDTTGLTTNSNSRTFGVGWSLLLPGRLPTVSLGYAQNSATSSLFGSTGQSDSTGRTFSIRSANQIAGFSLSGSFVHGSSKATSTELQSIGSAPEIEDTSTNSYTFTARHRIPLHGSFDMSYSRTSYDFTGSAVGGGSSGVTDGVYANANAMLGIFPVSANLNYTDNLYGSVLEQQISSGSPVYQTTLGTESRALLVDASTSYRLLHQIFITAYVSQQEQYLYGQSYGVTQYGVNANYNFSRRLKGLTVTLGMNDAADKAGNLGAGLIANVNYYRKLGAWDLTANYNYSQNVQTLLAMYTMSNMTYMGNARRRLFKGINWTAGVGGGRSGFTEQAGSGSHSEGANTSLTWRGVSLGGNYSQSAGTSVLTTAGLVTQPLPVASADELVVFNGKAYGVGIGGSPIRNLSLTATYSHATSTIQGESLNNNETEMINALCTYHFRKVFFTSGVTRFRQTIGGAGSEPSVITSYYFGISRWFKFF